MYSNSGIHLNKNGREGKDKSRMSSLVFVCVMKVKGLKRDTWDAEMLSKKTGV